MNHFGIVFGAIVATVIGGALIVEHSLEDDEIKAPQAAVQPAPVTEPTSSASSESTPAAVATSDAAPESAVTIADAGSSAARAPDRARPLHRNRERTRATR